MSSAGVDVRPGDLRPSPVLGVPAPRPPEPERPAAARACRSWADAARPRLVPGDPASRPPAAKRGATALDHLLTVLAVLGLVVTGLTVAASVVGLRPLVVRSGSMEPMIQTGGMVLVRAVPAADVRVGDVVAVQRPDGIRVTHRVLSARLEGARVVLQLKGDANDAPDPDPVAVTGAGRVVWAVPLVGRLSTELTSARGGFVLGCLVTAGFTAALRSRRPVSP